MSNIIEGKITLYPTRIIIDPYLERNSLIENSLSVYDKVTHSYAFQAFIKDEVNNRLIIPTGYSVNYLLGMYPHYKIENKCNAMENYIEANRSKYKIKMKYDCRNELQKAAMNFLNKRKPRSKFKYMQRFLSLKTGEGKAQPINIIIPTPNGYKKFGDLKIGDLVFNRYGKPVKVTGVFPKGQLKNYKVTLDDGRVTYCNDDHLWNVRYQTVDPKTKKTIYKEKTITLKEMIKKGIYKGPRNTYRYSIPINKPVEYIEQTLPIHPYVLGALIGNGCFTERAVSISSNDEFIVNKIGKLLNLKPIKQHESNYSWYFELETPTNKKRYLQNNEFLINENFNLTNLKSKDKFIPDLYKISSLEQRINLLQGLFDTDGYISIKDKRNSLTCNYTTVSKQLANDVCEILRSIGISCSISKDTHKDYKNEENCCYTVNIRCENKDKVQLFSLPRKKNIAIKYMNCKIRKDYNYIAIVSIEKMKETEEMQCIMVDDEEHLYLTNNYIVTHNTFCTIKYIADNHERPIIFVDQDSLGQQWKDRILEYTDTKENEIFYISGAKSVNKLMKMSSDDILKIKFFICCYRTLTINIKNTGSSSDISKLFDKIKVTMKVFDEAHLEYTSIFKLDMISNLRSLYLSATPKRSDKSEDKVYQNIFRNVDKFTSDSFTETPENYHNIIMCDWNSNPDIASETKCQTKYGFSMSRYCDYLMDKKYDKFEGLMYSLIFDTVLTNRKKKKMAILFGTNALLDKFYDNLVNFCAFNNYKLKINKFNGQTKKEDKLDLLEESDIIITTDKSFCKGIDVKDLQVVINTVPFIADTKLIQTVGRLRKLQNKEVIFIDINDIGFKSLRYQESSKKTIFSKLAKNLFIMNYK